MARLAKGNIRTRGKNTWEISIGIDEGRRRSRTIKGTKTLAQTELTKMLADRKTELEAKRVPDSDTTLEQWLGRWIKDVVQPERKVITVERYEALIRTRINPALGNVTLKELRVMSLQDFVKGMDLAPSTVNVVRAILSGALGYAVRMELLDRNPMDNVKGVKQRPVLDKTPPTLERVRTLLELARAQDHDLFPAVWLLASNGLRIGELVGLKWNHVNLAGGFLEVRDNVVRTKSKGLLTGTPKSGETRTVSLSEATMTILVEHRAKQDVHIANMEGTYQDNWLLFPNQLGQPRDPNGIRKLIRRMGERAGIEGLTPHLLRHAFATNLLEAGENPTTVSKELGHSKVSITTDMYSHSLPSWRASTAERMSALLAGEPKVGNRVE